MEWIGKDLEYGSKLKKILCLESGILLLRCQLRFPTGEGQKLFFFLKYSYHSLIVYRMYLSQLISILFYSVNLFVGFVLLVFSFYFVSLHLLFADSVSYTVHPYLNKKPFNKKLWLILSTTVIWASIKSHGKKNDVYKYVYKNFFCHLLYFNRNLDEFFNKIFCCRWC